MLRIYLENVKVEYLVNWITKYWESLKGNKFPTTQGHYEIQEAISFKAFNKILTILVNGNYLYYDIEVLPTELVRLEIYPWTDENVRIDFVECVSPLENDLMKMFKDPWLKNAISHEEEIVLPIEKALKDAFQGEENANSSKLKDRLKEPWEQIPDKGLDQEIIKLWCKGLKYAVIAERVGLAKGTVNNKISSLRKKYPDAKIPRDNERIKRVDRNY